MDPSGIMAGARSLLQTNETYHTNTPEGCNGATCLLFHILTITFMLLIVMVIVALVWYKRWKIFRAVQKGNVPATMLISYADLWTVKPAERGELEAFTFPVHPPERREDINEDSCPVCLKDMPKAKSWVVFDGCRHATCLSCFKKLVRQQRLHVACPMCRSLLAVGEGNRGGPGPKPAAEAPPADAEEEPAAPPTAPASDQV